MANAIIITIGDELLIGQVIDTNSSFIAQELNKIGISVLQRIAVGDNKQDIWDALNAAHKKSDVIILTGGLGPTADDITKPLLNEYFGGTMVINAAVLEHIEAIFKRFNRPMLAVNIKQAEVPDVCTVLFNERGTAPGMLFTKENTICISLPGVPHEMKGLMQDKVVPYLKENVLASSIIHETIVTAGEGESFVAERLKDFEASLPQHIKLAYLPNYGMLRLRLTVKGSKENEIALQQEIQWFKNKLAAQLNNIIIADKDTTLSNIIAALLIEYNLTMTTAESCTGGYIAHQITANAGSSTYFNGSVIAYQNSIKENVLKVPANVLETEGAVSEPTVIQMAKEVLAITRSKVSIAVSGIMGPGGGTHEKPVGTVWIAVANNSKVETQLLQLRFDRIKNIEITCMSAMLLLRKFIIAQYS
jgi:nicotinamide-nucleotide amidase